MANILIGIKQVALEIRTVLLLIQVPNFATTMVRVLAIAGMVMMEVFMERLFPALRTSSACGQGSVGSIMVDGCILMRAHALQLPPVKELVFIPLLTRHAPLSKQLAMTEREEVILVF